MFIAPQRTPWSARSTSALPAVAIRAVRLVAQVVRGPAARERVEVAGEVLAGRSDEVHAEGDATAAPPPGMCAYLSQKDPGAGKPLFKLQQAGRQAAVALQAARMHQAQLTAA